MLKSNEHHDDDFQDFINEINTSIYHRNFDQTSPIKNNLLSPASTNISSNQKVTNNTLTPNIQQSEFQIPSSLQAWNKESDLQIPSSQNLNLVSDNCQNLFNDKWTPEQPQKSQLQFNSQFYSEIKFQQNVNDQVSFLSQGKLFDQQQCIMPNNGQNAQKNMNNQQYKDMKMQEFIKSLETLTISNQPQKIEQQQQQQFNMHNVPNIMNNQQFFGQNNNNTMQVGSMFQQNVNQNDNVIKQFNMRQNYCLCRVEQSQTPTRNIKMNIKDLQFQTVKQFLQQFAEIQNIDVCGLNQKKEIVVSFYSQQQAINIYNMFTTKNISGAQNQFTNQQIVNKIQVTYLQQFVDFDFLDFILFTTYHMFQLSEVKEFCSHFGAILEIRQTQDQMIDYYLVRFNDIRSLKKIQIASKDFQQNQLLSCQYYNKLFNTMYQDLQLINLFNSILLFNKETSTDIYLYQFDLSYYHEQQLQNNNNFNQNNNNNGQNKQVNQDAIQGVIDEDYQVQFKQNTQQQQKQIGMNQFANMQTENLNPNLIFFNLLNNNSNQNDQQLSFQKQIPQLLGQHTIQPQQQQSNQINLFKIQTKQDQRTTLMVRNIPNRYNQDTFLKLIDQQFKGLYDFVYLPMDFKNKCNIGYAFINFIYPQVIIDFYNYFNGKRWDLYRSEKVCTINYARIQGRTQLIEHFKRSNLMNLIQDNKYKPLIVPNPYTDFFMFYQI